jgi:hypothetical protein
LTVATFYLKSNGKLLGKENIMAIIEICDKTAEGAYQSSDYKDVWLRKTHIGKCIKEREANGRDDSDFYMTVWNDETNSPEEILFATTRGWSYPCFSSSVDATPEVLAKYDAYVKAAFAKRERDYHKGRVLTALANRRLLKTAALKFDIPYGQLVAIRRLPEYEKILALFGDRVRSEFKKSLRKQVLDWASSANKKYPHPLSKKQREYL